MSNIAVLPDKWFECEAWLSLKQVLQSCRGGLTLEADCLCVTGVANLLKRECNRKKSQSCRGRSINK